MPASIDLLAFYYSANSSVLLRNNCIRPAGADEGRMEKKTPQDTIRLLTERRLIRLESLLGMERKREREREREKNGHSTRWAPLEDESSEECFIFAYFFLHGLKEEGRKIRKERLTYCVCVSLTRRLFEKDFFFFLFFTQQIFSHFSCARCMGI